ncbi:MAG: PadR family transcriptional regulator [Candidatus Protochlamydia sp.]|nr:PadR family transcriptional regulator [Candidatus Protochlamydia sp.]
MAKSSKSKFAIMGMLALAPKSSGYDIKKLMEESTQYFWKETYSSIYPVLGLLVQERLIIQHEVVSNSDRQRNVYELTAEGKRELQEWINKPVEGEQLRNELLLKLFFGEIVPPSTTRQHVEEYQRMLDSKFKLYNSIKDKLQLEHKTEPGLPYWLMTLEFGLGQLTAAKQWCESTLQQYKKLERDDQF